MISIIHPSRGRPGKAFDTFKKWLVNHVYGVYSEYILSIDVDDPERNRYLELFEVGCNVIINQNQSAVDAVNNGAKYAAGDILMVLSDDMEPCEDWIEKMLKEVEGKTDWILKTQDGIQDYIITLPIMDRAYYNRTGYIYHPSYQHLFADTELTCVADLLNRKIKSNLMFKHNHYSVNGTAPDDLHKRNDATWKQGEENFIKRYRNNFDLINPPGRISDTSMNNWLRQKSR